MLIYLLHILSTSSAPLSLSFVNDTPLVVEYYMTAHFIANREGVQMKCNIPRLGNEKTDCKFLIVDVYLHLKIVWSW